MRLLKTLAFIIFFCSGFVAFSHPDDEMDILEQQGQFNIRENLMDAEYEAALKRQRMRILAAMPALEKFSLFVGAGVEHIIPKGLDHILFVLGLFFFQFNPWILIVAGDSFYTSTHNHPGACRPGNHAGSRQHRRAFDCTFDCLGSHRELCLQASSKMAAFGCIRIRPASWF